MVNDLQPRPSTVRNWSTVLIRCANRLTEVCGDDGDGDRETAGVVFVGVEPYIYLVAEKCLIRRRERSLQGQQLPSPLLECQARLHLYIIESYQLQSDRRRRHRRLLLLHSRCRWLVFIATCSYFQWRRPRRLWVALDCCLSSSSRSRARACKPATSKNTSFSLKFIYRLLVGYYNYYDCCWWWCYRRRPSPVFT